jgi:hypothetical protein
MSRTVDVERMLQELGSTPAQVAQTLAAKNIKGTRNAVRALNPIVRYIQTGVAKSDDINVMLGDTLRITFPPGTMEEVRLPPAVYGFLAAFNQGAYPALELEKDKT